MPRFIGRLPSWAQGLASSPSQVNAEAGPLSRLILVAGRRHFTLRHFAFRHFAFRQVALRLKVDHQLR